MNITLDEIFDVFSRFRRDCPIASYGLPVEDLLSVEQELTVTMRCIQSLTTSALQALRESIDLHLAVLLNQYAHRMASAAVHKKNDELVGCALTAISLDQDLLDDRDIYRTGALMIDCMHRRNLDINSCYREYLAIATENCRTMLIRQLTTAPEYMRLLRSMSFGVIETDASFSYVDQLFESPIAIDVDLVNKTIAELTKAEPST